MKAMVYSPKSPPPAMHLTDIATPVPASGQVLVRVHSVSLNAADYRSMQMGIGPKSGIYGADIAGRIEAVGPGTTKFQIGDAVFGDLSSNQFGGLAEYVTAPESLLTAMPDTVTFEQAAALPMASVTALQALRDKGRIQPGHHVLIVGASGGVGLYAIQLAKNYGATVTALCSSTKTELATSLGADTVVDYAQTPLRTLPKKFDIILAINGNYPLLTYKKLLTPSGTCVMIGGSLSQIARFFLLAPLLSIGPQKLRILAAKPSAEDRTFIMNLVQEGHIHPVIDRRYSLTQAWDAYNYIKAGHSAGKVVVNVIR